MEHFSIRIYISLQIVNGLKHLKWSTTQCLRLRELFAKNEMRMSGIKSLVSLAFIYLSLDSSPALIAINRQTNSTHAPFRCRKHREALLIYSISANQNHAVWTDILWCNQIPGSNQPHPVPRCVYAVTLNPANTKHWAYTGLMVGKRRSVLAIIQRLVNIACLQK